MTSRKYLFTINNPTEGEILALSIIDVKFIVYQREQGHQDNTIHYQGWVVWRKPIRPTQCRTWLGGRAHVEVQRGTNSECYEYCTKLDTRLEGPWERGTKPEGGGTRTDLAACKELILNGAPDRELGLQFFGTYVRYHRGFEAFRKSLAIKKREPPTVEIFWGATGTGKTRKVYEDCDAEAFWMMRGNWFDGYDGQRHVVIDDFYAWMPWSQLLRILDRYPCRVPTKGGSVVWQATHIWITSNQDPREWYEYRRGMEWATLKRRVTSIVHFNEALES